MSLSNKTAIVGIGATEFSKKSGRSEMQLAAEATLAALHDSGLKPSDVDGMCTYTLDNNGESELARTIGAGELTFFSQAPYGGGATCAPLLQAALAVNAGIAKTVVCYRAMNERSEYRFGTPGAAVNAMGVASADQAMASMHHNMGLSTPGAWVAMGMRRYMHETGTTSEDFARLSVVHRKHASTNPKAHFYGKPITVDDYMNSRMIVDPFRLFDFCQESDGAVAVVITSAERAKSLRQKPVMIRAAALASARGQTIVANYYRKSIWRLDEMTLLARQLFAMSGLGPGDMDAAMIYDHFLPTVLPSLEALGFCGDGEAKDFIKGGTIEIGGRLPLNTHGGLTGEAYIHGLNSVAEGVRQVRGIAVNQVAGLENVLVTSGGSVPCSAVILGVA